MMFGSPNLEKQTWSVAWQGRTLLAKHSVDGKTCKQELRLGAILLDYDEFQAPPTTPFRVLAAPVRIDGQSHRIEARIGISPDLHCHIFVDGALVGGTAEIKPYDQTTRFRLMQRFSRKGILRFCLEMTVLLSPVFAVLGILLGGLKRAADLGYESFYSAGILSELIFWVCLGVLYSPLGGLIATGMMWEEQRAFEESKRIKASKLAGKSKYIA
jgi:hypothetical protein